MQLSEYERRARAVKCKRCKAKIGEPCTSVNGHYVRPHAPRREAANLPQLNAGRHGQLSKYQIMIPPKSANPLFKGRFLH